MMLTGGIEAAEGKSYLSGTGALAGASCSLARCHRYRRRLLDGDRHRFVPCRRIARHILVEHLCLEIGLDHAGVVAASAKAAQRSAVQPSRTASTCAATPKRSSSTARRRRAERGGEIGVALAGEGEPVGEQRQPRRHIGTAPAVACGPANTVFSQAFSTASPARAVETGERRAGRQRRRRELGQALRQRAPLGRALVLRQAVENGGNPERRQ